MGSMGNTQGDRRARAPIVMANHRYARRPAGSDDPPAGGDPEAIDDGAPPGSDSAGAGWPGVVAEPFPPVGGTESFAVVAPAEEAPPGLIWICVETSLAWGGRQERSLQAMNRACSTSV
ncbi:MAG: hypothetical protein P8Y94_10155 [Acidobacteriota bacterium]